MGIYEVAVKMLCKKYFWRKYLYSFLCLYFFSFNIFADNEHTDGENTIEAENVASSESEETLQRDEETAVDPEALPLGFDKEEMLRYANVKPTIKLSPENERIVIANPTPEEIENILAAAYDAKGEFVEKMHDYIVGIPGCDRLMTLADAYREKLLSETGAGAILQKVSGFSEGETATISLQFGMRQAMDIEIGRFPGSIVPYHLASELYYPGDPSLGPLTKWLEIMGHLTWASPLQQAPGQGASPHQGARLDYKINNLASALIFNYFQQPERRNYFVAGNINPIIAGAGAGVATPESAHSLWFNMMSGYAAVGYTGLYNIEENQMGLSAVGAGAFVGGWKNYVTAGVSP